MRENMCVCAWVWVREREREVGGWYGGWYEVRTHWKRVCVSVSVREREMFGGRGTHMYRMCECLCAQMREREMWGGRGTLVARVCVRERQCVWERFYWREWKMCFPLSLAKVCQSTKQRRQRQQQRRQQHRQHRQHRQQPTSLLGLRRNSFFLFWRKLESVELRFWSRHAEQKFNSAAAAAAAD